MLGRLQSHVRHNVVAYLALFVALGGTSYAAVDLPRDSVGSRELRDGSVRGRDLAVVRKTLRVRLRPDNVHYVDTGPSGASVGDMIVRHLDLLDEGGRKIGTYGGPCVVTVVEDGSRTCTDSYHLKDGDIYVVAEATHHAGTVAGGTGAYLGSTGQVTGGSGPDDGTIALVLDLTIPRR
jgi:hypothetical protein